MTYIDIGIHMTVANRLVTASRETLAPNHPIRRLVKPFTFRSVSINYSAGRALFHEHGMLHRAFALTEKGMRQTWEFAVNSHKYETIPNSIKRRNVDTVALPFDQDALDYWDTVYSFVSKYMDLYYGDRDVNEGISSLCY